MISSGERTAPFEPMQEEPPAGKPPVKALRLMQPPMSWMALAVLALAFLAALAVAAFQSPVLDVVRPAGNWRWGDASWWLHPLELNANRRFVPGAHLYGVHGHSDGQRVWVVGAGHVIWHSRDGGLSWHRQYPASETAVAFATGIRSRNDWVPLSSAIAADVPSKSARKSSGKAGNDLINQAPPAVTAPAATSSPVQTRTPPSLDPTKPAAAPPVDSASAQTQTPPPFEPVDPAPDGLLAIQFDDDGRVGWAVGSGGTIVSTIDGGDHWVRQSSGTSQALWSIAFRRLDSVWVVGDDAQVRVSTDRGAHWNEQRWGSADRASSSPYAGLSSAQAARSERLHAVVTSMPFGDNRFGVWMAGNLGTVVPWIDSQASSSPAGASASNAPVGNNLSPNPKPIFGLALSASGESGWAVGQDGTMLQLSNGGWQQGAAYAATTLRSVSVAANRAVAVGDDGILLKEGDKPWEPRQPASKPAAMLRSVHLTANGVGWAAGDAGAVLATRDAGQTWHWLSTPPDLASPAAPTAPTEAPRYSVYPSPAAITAGILSLAFLVPLVRVGRFTRNEAAPAETPARYPPGLNDDQPLHDMRKDRLGHAGTVKALASFIRNAETEPRLAIAVTAPWGQGKSSVMRMLQTELQNHGYRTAWFNAWHHQQEGRPLSALFNVIGSQALPRSLVPRWWLRYRLIWQRGTAYRVLVLLTVAALTILGADIVTRTSRFDRPWSTVADTLQWKFADHLMGEPRVVLTARAVEALNPCAAANAKLPAASSTPGASSLPSANRRCEPCNAQITDPAFNGKASQTGIRPEAYCAAAGKLLWQSLEGQPNFCQDAVTHRSTACVFRNSGDLVRAIETDIGQTLSPTERKAVAAAAESLSPPDLLPFTEKLLPVLAVVLGLLVTKGVSVYGFEVLKPLRLLLSPGSGSTPEGKEATGIIERYRAQFGHLSKSLNGRLVIFVDDLDRCTEQMVNSVLEMSNYLTDIGECFIVMGADLKLVKQCIKAPGEKVFDEAYANRYLRKLIHIEVPVPLTTQQRLRTLVDPVADDASQASRDPRLLPPDLGQVMASSWPRAVWTLMGIAVVAGSVLVVTHFRSTEQRTVAAVPVPVSNGVGGSNFAALPRAASEGLPAASTPASAAPASAVSSGPAASAIARPAAPVATSRLSNSALIAIFTLAVVAGLIALWFARPDMRPRDRLRALQERLVLATGGAIQTYDTKDFSRALAIWLEAVFMADGTPRGAKRFRNKARFFGTLLDFQPHGVVGANARTHAAALVALNFVMPEALGLMSRGMSADELTNEVAGLARRLASVEEPVETRLAATAARCLAQHVQSFGAITPELVLAFQELAGSVEVR